MRLCHVLGSEETMENSPYVVQSPEERKGHWKELLGNESPIEIEAEMGKGKFIMELAQKNPDVNYIGIKRYLTVMLKALQKRKQLELSNIYLICVDIKELGKYFEEGEVSGIFLNFSGPWPKDRHAKGRLTSPQSMTVYGRILKKDGMVELKTDNRGLFDCSLESISEAGWIVDNHIFDLHHSDMAEGNMMTEYEIKFASEGKSICRPVAYGK